MGRCPSTLVRAVPWMAGLVLLCAAPVRAEVYVEAYRSPSGAARVVSTGPPDGSCWVASIGYWDSSAGGRPCVPPVAGDARGPSHRGTLWQARGGRR
jgi:hypothetical protein